MENEKFSRQEFRLPPKREFSHKIQEPVKDSSGATRACAQYFSPLFNVDMKRLCYCYSHVAAVQLIDVRAVCRCRMFISDARRALRLLFSAHPS